ncbi:hypothetical protein RO3G_09528 [Rhizopus delemar RA 99-880]|uniref:Uncharacterized protein n=1 Tax=Rhizopus delemar (strain RA 99-880 / ATCC MYA-4621 / FGSC 9543 / NRRL 43880) TaxID=246409 RepID=I1C8N8_RHIO9|nr:hypothetical protein RO3G_09528 [Rhizopus delemar RA 99-880]|eukprot:EIE84818.1 hypothetical protein RO3G_09528 [Rhizopus delemar RA 99-880]
MEIMPFIHHSVNMFEKYVNNELIQNPVSCTTQIELP